MPIIKSKSTICTDTLKAELNPLVLEQIEQYCQWAGIYDMGYFIEKAANHLLQHDLDWNLHKKEVDGPVETIELSIINPQNRTI